MLEDGRLQFLNFYQHKNGIKKSEIIINLIFQVKFFAEMQQTIDEDRERARKEELERQAAEKEAERIETAKEKPKGKTKKERKKETKPKVEDSINNEINSTSHLVNEPSQKRTFSIWKILLYSFLLWFVFALGVVFVIAKSPHIIEELIGKLPGSYQSTLLYHFEKIQHEILKFLK